MVVSVPPASAAAENARVGRLQRSAADPDSSIWVAASAGSGKTKVLADRVLRLLLGGAKPERILCLTFTRAAAAEMANRINLILAKWAVMPEDALAKALAELTGDGVGDGERARFARRLFAQVLDAPFGLRIQTIHAFCQSLIARFPLEAGVAPHFEAIDERSADEALAQARDGAFADAGNESAISLLARHGNEARLSELIGKLIKTRGKLASALDAHGDAEGVGRAVGRHLGLCAGESTAQALAAFGRADEFDGVNLARAAKALAEGAVIDQAASARIAAWLADEGVRAERFDDYALAFFTKDGEVRKKLATKKVVMIWPAILDVMAKEAERVAGTRARLQSIAVAEATGALVALGADILTRYRDHKRRYAKLDYDDLILGARRLVAEGGRAAWVLYKLDGGIDHVLVDEAQDTSPEQWQIIGALTEEFFAGEGARARGRSIFAVGDPKQSIFSFQGVEPTKFAEVRDGLAARARAAGAPWQEIGLDVSFRSTAAVLGAVDAVFAHAQARDGVADQPPRHEAFRAGMAGRVELWPLVGPRAAEERAAWSPPAFGNAQRKPSTRLARTLARKIHGWTRAERAPADAELPARGRRMSPGDIMVLVRHRDEFAEALVRELKILQVPVAGVDRMVLTQQLSVMDLIALGKVLLLPEDDLTLAALLKSPLIGLDEQALFDLAHGREGSLWNALAASRVPQAATAHAFLERLRARADFVRPYELYAEVLNTGGRRNMLARLGPDANDPIDEFLSQALAYERTGPPSLQGFLHWLAAGEVEIKRELEQAAGSVRIMTVHGSKGLQAPVVVMPDTTSTPTTDDSIFWQDGLPLWAPKKSDRDAVVTAALAQARLARDREYRRLLYVAMTRAEDRLIVCGAHGAKGPSGGCWYQLVRAGLAAAGAVETEFAFAGEDGWVGPGLVLEGAQSAEASAEEPHAEHGVPDRPAWFWRLAPTEPRPPRPLAPSRQEVPDPPPISPFAGGDARRFKRGLLVHRLLQYLPDSPPAERAARAEAYLARQLDLDGEARLALTREALAVLEAPELAHAFGPDSRAEVPLIGRLNGTLVVGQVDRMAVSGGVATILDYKSNRPPPARAEDAGPAYLRQMALYRALVRRIHPDHTVRVMFVWTDGPRVMALPDALLDRHDVDRPTPDDHGPDRHAGG
ncbi:MAG: double-strand break repair helicase AddA [Alphaproteobacteria bacterium]